MKTATQGKLIKRRGTRQLQKPGSRASASGNTGTLTFANQTDNGGIGSRAVGTTTVANAINLGNTIKAIRFASTGSGNILDITTSSFTDGGGTGAISILMTNYDSGLGYSSMGVGGTVRFSGTDFTIARKCHRLPIQQRKNRAFSSQRNPDVVRQLHRV